MTSRPLIAILLAVAICAGVVLGIVWSVNASRGPISIHDERGGTDPKRPGRDALAPGGEDGLGGAREAVTREGRDEVPFPLLVVSVVDDDGVPLEGARAEVGVRSEGTRSSTTDAAGETSFHLTEDSEVLYVRVRARTYAAHTRSFSSDQEELGEPPVLSHRAVMAPGGAVEVVVSGSYGEPLDCHPIDLRYRGEAKEAEARPPFDEYRLAFTDARGIAVVDGLMPGDWSLNLPDWKQYSRSAETRLFVPARATPRVELSPESELAPEDYASGRIAIPGPLEELDCTLTNWFLSLEDSNTRRHILFSGGEFVLYGVPEDPLTARLVSADHEVRSLPFTISMGQHDQLVIPTLAGSK